VPSIEERVTALEFRVDRLGADGQHATDIAVVAAREALTAREAHQRNIELLNALRTTQMEHSRVLDEHSRRFDTFDAKFGQLTVGMHTVESLLRRLVDEDQAN
jgi:hypothetical protein